MFHPATAERTMETLIVFLLSSIHTLFAAHLPVEVFEIRETNDNQLYVKNSKDPYRQDGDTRLASIIKPYRLSNVDRITKELLAKLQVLRKNRQKNNQYKQEIYVIDGDLLEAANYADSNDESDGFVDQTRHQLYKPVLAENIVYHVLPQKGSNKYQFSQNILRTEDRTAAPRHKYHYERESD